MHRLHDGLDRIVRDLMGCFSHGFHETRHFTRFPFHKVSITADIIGSCSARIASANLACAPPFRRMSAAERAAKLDTAITLMLKGLTRK